MGLKDKLKTVFKNWGSKRSENSNVKELEDAIYDEEVKINEKTADIGEFYWNLFQKNAFVPEPDAKDLFISIRNSLQRIETLKKQIDDTRVMGNQERDQNNQDLAELERRQAEEAERRKQERERLEAELAAKKKAEKEAQVELERLKREAAKKQ